MSLPGHLSRNRRIEQVIQCDALFRCTPCSRLLYTLQHIQLGRATKAAEGRLRGIMMIANLHDSSHRLQVCLPCLTVCRWRAAELKEKLRGLKAEYVAWTDRMAAAEMRMHELEDQRKL
jgi:predicted  nucleic acid-binding Zn-ribbon protein